TLKVWDAATGQDTLTLRGHSRAVQSVAWSGDGKRIVSASWDNTLMVWDAITGQDTLTLKEPKAPVRSVAWSRDGKRIVSGSDDKTLTMWEAITDEETISLTEHTRTPSESAAGVRRTYRLRTETMLQAGEYAEAAKRAILFHETNPSNFLDTFVAARFLARCVPLAQDDAKLSEEQRAKLADAYGTQAVQLLDKAINMANDYKSRLKNIHDLMNAPDLEPLRKRKDFQKQLADVEKKEKSDSK
ncbi:MAG TPA: hypothetical protein VGZ25_07915, partial [Gemmataceae bacterium]|nr:hypothetical protein [Gemmataceae bacterium]